MDRRTDGRLFEKPVCLIYDLPLPRLFRRGLLLVGRQLLEGVNATAATPPLRPAPFIVREQKGAKIHSHIKCATVCIILMSLINHFYVGAKSKDGRANAVFQGRNVGRVRVSHMHLGKGVLRLWLMGFSSTPPLHSHSSIKIRYSVSKTRAGLLLHGRSVYLLLTPKRPRGRIAVLLRHRLRLQLQQRILDRDLECANCP